ncbi:MULTISPECIES: helix-turn-helix domain-containing protein [Catenuloplanes]|uniref:AraC-like DNA-binding protein n=1 Tax=Catenuloplanes niger TaxID=587534 RepID=A0AAE3ZLV9_9ACTN|nr:helix-turn-helix domain-containing protein [Catenuloplanes niger]MDR7321020.1 AraC-like DNA-binding protein [Catenuloplanes niger]
MSASRGTVRLDTERIDDGTFGDWDRQIGLPLPRFTQDTTGASSRLRGVASRARDVAVMDFHTTTRVRAGGVPGRGELRLHVVQRGAWTFRYGRDAVPVPAGRFLLGRSTGMTGFDVGPRTTARTVGLSPGALAPLTGDPFIRGAAGAPEVRLLLAHASMLHETIGELTEAGLGAARDAMVELVRGVLHGYVDEAEPRLAHALARAARDLADTRLTDPELTPATLARALHVSVRTLHRAFAGTGEPVTAYLRRRRLEEAHAALTAAALVSAAPPAVSALAARWHFADSSHFIRAFRRHYGLTPARYAREVARRAPGEPRT